MFRIILTKQKNTTMKIYILIERTTSGRVSHEVTRGYFEDENYAILEKAKRENEGTINRFFVKEADLVTGEVSMWEQDGEIIINDEEMNTVAVVDVETFVDEIPVSMDFNDRILTANCISLGSVKVFGESVDSLGLVNGLDREIENAAEGKVELLNE